MHGADKKIYSWYFVYGRTRTTLPKASVCCIVCQVCLVGWWIRLAFLVLWSQFKASSLSLVLGPSSTMVWIVGVIILNHKRKELQHCWEWWTPEGGKTTSLSILRAVCYWTKVCHADRYVYLPRVSIKSGTTASFRDFPCSEKYQVWTRFASKGRNWDDVRIGMISGFCRKADERCTLLGYYVASTGNFLQTFWDNPSDPSSGVKNYHYSLHNDPEEYSTDLRVHSKLLWHTPCLS